MKKLLLLSLILCLAVSGCGGAGGSTTELNTVSLVTSPSSDRLEADMLNSNSCTAGGGTFVTETIPVTVTSTAYPNAIKPSPVTIDSIKISYIGYNEAGISHPLPIQFDTGNTINPGEAKVFNVKIAPDSLKINMVNNMGFGICSLDYWEYYAVITFSGTENFTNKSVSFTEKVKVAFADRNNTP